MELTKAFNRASKIQAFIVWQMFSGGMLYKVFLDKNVIYETSNKEKAEAVMNIYNKWGI